MVKEPERSCVVCRGREPRRALLRVVAPASELVFDRGGRRPGRGAYVHAAVACLNRVESARLWERALRLTAGSLREEPIAALARELRQAGSGPEGVRELIDG